MARKVVEMPNLPKTALDSLDNHTTEAADTLREAESAVQEVRIKLEEEFAMNNYWGQVKAKAEMRVKTMEEFMKIFHLVIFSPIMGVFTSLWFLSGSFAFSILFLPISLFLSAMWLITRFVLNRMILAPANRWDQGGGERQMRELVRKRKEAYDNLKKEAKVKRDNRRKEQKLERAWAKRVRGEAIDDDERELIDADVKNVTACSDR